MLDEKWWLELTIGECPESWGKTLFSGLIYSLSFESICICLGKFTLGHLANESRANELRWPGFRSSISHLDLDPGRLSKAKARFITYQSLLRDMSDSAHCVFIRPENILCGVSNPVCVKRWLIVPRSLSFSASNLCIWYLLNFYIWLNHVLLKQMAPGTTQCVNLKQELKVIFVPYCLHFHHKWTTVKQVLFEAITLPV